MPPVISVILPTYNRAHFLKEAILSVLSQTYADFELIVADDASKDETSELVSSFHDTRIRFFRHSANIGITPNWKFTFDQSQGDLIAPLADDDMYMPNHLASAVQVLADHPTTAYYTSSATYFGEADTGEYRPRAILDTTTPVIYVPPTEAVRFLGIDTPGPMNAMVCRKTAFKDVFWGPRGFIPQDQLIMTQLMVQGGFLFGNQSTYLFRLHAANTSRAKGQKQAIQRYNCMVWYGIRWLAQFLLSKRLCTTADLEAHGRQAVDQHHVVPVVLGLGSFDSPPALYQVAQRIFEARPDMDAVSSRFRLARRLGFWTIPVLERLTQLRVGWRPKA